MSRLRLALTSLVLALLLAVPAAAAPYPAGKLRREPARITLAVRFLGFLTNLFGKNGGSLDPFGSPIPSAQGTTPGVPAVQGDSTDNGGSLDPFGGH